MPELPEVESLCRKMRTILEGQCLASVQAITDSIVFKNETADQIEKRLTGHTVKKIGRRGKYFWWELSDELSLIGHLGMSGWMEFEPKEGETPRFAKLIVETSGGKRLAITDARRLGRIWLVADPLKDPAIKRLGPDAYEDLPKNPKFSEMILKRKAPVKAVLLDQSFLSGIGNYLADEILYHSHIAPQRKASDLTKLELKKLRTAITEIIGTAVHADADETRFPATWLFHHRWGGKRGPDKIGSHPIVRETVAGRTTAWVPEIQK
jgi:formamidopyrimidine-DNA glycosylase